MINEGIFGEGGRLIMAKKFYGVMFLGMLALLIPGLRADASGEIYRKPFLSGASQTWIYAGDTYDSSDIRNRVFADDLEDGDLTGKIKETYNNVNANTPGDYKISYEVKDKDGNVSKMDVQVTVVDRNSAEEKTVQRTLYTLGDASHLTGIGFNRGYYHDRQNLGIWLPKGTELEIRLVNGDEFGQNLKIDFMNEDAKTESSAVIPVSGEFVTVKNVFEPTSEGGEESRDSVPFIVTPKQTDVQPIVEFKWKDEFKEISYYRYGDSEADFFKSWKASDDPYAVIEGTTATMLVPIKDRDEITNSSYTSTAEYRFGTIDEMLEWYDAFVEQYDSYAGLDFYAEEPYNQNLRSRFFVKANVSGVGQAYYTLDHSAYTGDSLQLYLTRSWLSLHEFGHGYEGAIATQEHPFVETTNNIMGYYFESTYRPDTDFGWLLGGYAGTKEQRQAALEQRALLRRTQTTSFAGIVAGALHYDVSLYMFVNALDKIGPQEAVAAMHEAYRKNYYDTKKCAASSDTILSSFSDTGAYNFVPYFESYHIEPSVKVKDAIYAKDYPMVYYLKDLVPDDKDAEEIRKDLKLDGVYSLVSTDELAYTGYTSTVTLKIQIDDLKQIENKAIVIKNGSRIVKSVPVTEEVMTIELPAGIYEAELPVPNEGAYNYEDTYLIASAGTAEKELIYERESGNPLIDDIGIKFCGISEGVFAVARMDSSENKLIWKSESKTPHAYFGNEIYARIRVLNAAGVEVFSQSFIGGVEAEEIYQEIDFPVGSQIEIFHQEASSRMLFYSAYTGDTLKQYAASNGETTVYVMTEYGLVRQEWDVDRQKAVYQDVLNSYLQYVMENTDSAALTSEKMLHREKLLLNQACQVLDETEQEKYREKWKILFEEDVTEYTIISQIPSKMLSAAADSEAGVGTDGVAADAVDGDESTYWHSNYKGVNTPNIAENVNNTFTITLAENRDICQLVYVPRSDNANGRILKYELYYSTTESGENFQKIALESNQWEDTLERKTAEFDAPNARRIHIRVLGTAGHVADTYISAAEFYLYERVVKNLQTQNSYLSDLYCEYTESGYVPYKDKNAYGETLTLVGKDGEKQYEKGIGIFTGQTVSYDLTGKGFDTFMAAVGMDAAETKEGAAKLQVYGDGVLLYESGNLHKGMLAEGFSVNISGVEVLTLQVTGTEEQMAVTLGNARFYKTGDNRALVLKVGEIVQAASNNSVGTADETVWTSKNEDIAIVDAAGNVTGLGAGTTTVYAVTNGETVSYTVFVKEVEAVKVQLNQTQLTLKEGEIAVLTVAVFPEFATNKNVTWSSDNAAVTVSQDGTVTAVKEGTAVVRAASQSGVFAECTVTVQKSEEMQPVDPKPDTPQPDTPQTEEIQSAAKPSKVKLASVKRSGKKAVVKWKKNKTAEGYEIWMKTGKGKFKKVKTVSAKKTSVKTKKLKSGKKYTFKVRAYRKDSTGTKVYGAFSKTKSLTIR